MLKIQQKTVILNCHNITVCLFFFIK